MCKRLSNQSIKTAAKIVNDASFKTSNLAKPARLFYKLQEKTVENAHFQGIRVCRTEQNAWLQYRFIIHMSAIVKFFFYW